MSHHTQLPTMTETPILIIDDDNVTRLTLKKILHKQGYHVEEANSGEGGLAILEHYIPHLILLDVMMPGINGFETCRLIRNNFSYNETPIIMLTGLNDVASVDDAFIAGANDFITKPINWPLLVKRVLYAIRDRDIQIELAENEARLQHSQRIAKLAYWQMDLQNQEINLSDVFYEQFPTKHISANTFADYIQLIHPDDRDLLQNKLTELYKTKQKIEFDHRIKLDYLDYTFHLYAEAVLDQNNDVQALRGTLQNITQQRNAEALIEHQMYHDDLTGLPNKKQLVNELNKLLARKESDTHLTATVAIGLKRFSEINDSLGHQSADRLLKCFADRLNSLSGIEIAGRYEAQTFVVLINNLNGLDLLKSALDNMQQHLLTPYVVDKQEIFVDIRMGISIFPIEEGNSNSLISNALLALNNAKESINDKTCFHSPEMNQQAVRIRAIETHIRLALENDQLHLFYQPQIDLSSRKLIGAEALVRLELDDNDWMSPIDFIPVAEETGLIIPMGYWIIETACKQIRTWLDCGVEELRIGINLSAKQFSDPNLSTTLDNAVYKYRLPSHCIDLEITESVALDDLDQTINILQRFKQRGYTISMDDFGTGYSSLSSIHLLPIDILKIDRAFIKDIGRNGEHGAMAKTIINMSHNLNLSVIAEGAENEDHIEFLKANHCNEVQGFYYSRPLSADQFLEYYKQYINNESCIIIPNSIASAQ